MAKTVQFALGVNPSAPWAETVAMARHAENLGFNAIAMWDHVNAQGIDCIVGLSALAAATSKLKLWTNVMAAAYRPPSIVAKAIASLDAISGGRAILGMGSGWDEAEFRAYGFTFGTLSQRREQLAEAVQIVRAMWTNDRATFNGKTWSIVDAVCNPKPAQKPHPPIWIGTYGGKRAMAEVVIPYANGWNLGIPSTPDAPTPEATLQEFRQLCEAARRDPDDFTVSMNLMVETGVAQDGFKAVSGQHAVSSAKLLHLAEPRQAIDRLAGLARHGVSQFMIAMKSRDPIADLSRFASEIAGPLRASTV
jgi:alkanesulfonate monooxygenase SsuD/methylene tetrahydromethanopterin reductase-like flavin-dependent oxidoreductase (luciferase family)